MAQRSEGEDSGAWSSDSRTASASEWSWKKRGGRVSRVGRYANRRKPAARAVVQGDSPGAPPFLALRGLHIGPDGYARVADVMHIGRVAKPGPREQDILYKVRVSGQKRFQIMDGGSAGGPLIRAAQGHSVTGIRLDALCGDTVYNLRDGQV